MDIVTKSNLSLTQADASRLAALLGKVESIKNRQAHFLDRSPRTSRHPNTYLSDVTVRERKLGAEKKAAAKEYTYSKGTSPNEKALVLFGKEHLSYPLGNQQVNEKTVIAAGASEIYVFHRVASGVASDGSVISAEAIAENQLEHSEMLSQFASRPVAVVRTREGEIFLGCLVSGEVSLDAPEVRKFDASKLDAQKRAMLEESIVGFVAKAHSAGLTVGGLNASHAQFDGEVKPLNPLQIGVLDEDTVDRELNELVATLRAYEGGSTLASMERARERLAKKVYECSVVDRHAMREKGKSHKKPWLAAAERANTLAYYW